MIFVHFATEGFAKFYLIKYNVKFYFNSQQTQTEISTSSRYMED